MKKHIAFRIIIYIFVAVAMTLSSAVTAFAAGNSKTYITKLDIVDTEISEEYYVISSGLNLVEDFDFSESVDKLFIAYATGSERNAVTDIRVLTTYNKDGIEIGGVQYYPVSSVSLNDGTDGTAIYMYYTKDAGAGEPIMSLNVSAFRTDKEVESYDGDVLLGDGFEPVKNENDEPANLDLGRGGLNLYLHMLHKTVYKPYITDVHVAGADNRKGAISKLASLGCCYYIDENIMDGDGCVMVGYNRTTDASLAVTSLRGVTPDALNGNTVTEGATVYTVADKVSIDSREEVYLAYATGGNSPLYMMDIAMIYTDQDLTVANCAQITFGNSTVSRYLSLEPEYDVALNNEEPLKLVNIPMANNHEKTVNLSMVYKGTENFVQEQIDKIAETEPESEAETSECYTGELLTEEGEAIYFDDDESETAEGDTDETSAEDTTKIENEDESETEESSSADETASAFGIFGVITLIALVLLAGGGVLIVVLRKKKK